MLDLKTVNITTEMIEEVNLIPELTAARAQTTDPHGEEKPHRSTGRDLRREHCRSVSEQLDLEEQEPTLTLWLFSQTIVFAHFLRGHFRVRISGPPHVAQLVCETKEA
jgi:hypothetical protein